MKLNSPFQISSRLLPSIKIGNGSISIKLDGRTSDGLAKMRYYIDTPDFEYTANDLKYGVGGCSIQSGMESLLSFLSASVESYRSLACVYSEDPDENKSLFPRHVVEWAYQNDMEIQSLQCDLEENQELITD